MSGANKSASDSSQTTDPLLETNPTKSMRLRTASVIDSMKREDPIHVQLSVWGNLLLIKYSNGANTNNARHGRIDSVVCLKHLVRIGSSVSHDKESFCDLIVNMIIVIKLVATQPQQKLTQNAFPAQNESNVKLPMVDEVVEDMIHLLNKHVQNLRHLNYKSTRCRLTVTLDCSFQFEQLTVTDEIGWKGVLDKILRFKE